MLSLVLGLLPIALHTDGAEFYSNSEYMVWSMSSILSTAHVWDSKFPICIIPHSCMTSDAHWTVAKLVAWSLRHAASGVAPLVGFHGETLDGNRKEMAGAALASGWRACYFGFRSDEKARKESNFFQRTYQHSYICMYCMAQKEHNDWDANMSYKNMQPDAAYRMTTISYFAVELMYCGSLVSELVDSFTPVLGYSFKNGLQHQLKTGDPPKMCFCF